MVRIIRGYEAEDLHILYINSLTYCISVAYNEGSKILYARIASGSTLG